MEIIREKKKGGLALRKLILLGSFRKGFVLGISEKLGLEPKSGDLADQIQTGVQDKKNLVEIVLIFTMHAPLEINAWQKRNFE